MVAFPLSVEAGKECSCEYAPRNEVRGVYLTVAFDFKERKLTSLDPCCDVPVEPLLSKLQMGTNR